jgi:glutamate-1-semialdehyde 2,1-aminomutase
MIAGYTLLQELKQNPAIYRELDEKTSYLHKGLNEVLKASGIPYVINRLGSMISIHFSDHPVTDFASAAAARNELFKLFFHAMLKRGIYLPPSAFESWFLNNALTKADLDQTIEAAAESLKEIA